MIVKDLIARVQRRLPGVETTEVEAHMATYCLFATNHQRQVEVRSHYYTYLSRHIPCTGSSETPNVLNVQVQMLV